MIWNWPVYGGARALCLGNGVPALGIASFVLCVSCGGSSSGSSRGSGGSTGYQSTGAAPVAEADFRQQFPTAFCNVIRTCCTQAGIAFNPTVCQGFAGATLQPGLSYNAQAAGDCLQLARSTTTCDMSDSMADTLSPCDVVYSGSKALGETCESSAECASRTDGEVDCDGLDNVCAVTRRGAAGDPCTSSCEEYGDGGYICSSSANPALDPHESVQCFREEGLTCGPDLTCDALVPAGEPCTSDDQCVSAHYCASDGAERTCAPQLGMGGTCDAFTNACAEGNYCDSTNSMCAPKKPAGQACTGFDECQGQCTDNLCVAPSDLSGGFLALICGGSAGP
jgi:hypothetical protein